MKLILASSSPRRQQLLRAAGYEFDILAPDGSVEHGVADASSAVELVESLALAKAASVAGTIERGLVLAADTVAQCNGQILGKPRDVADARSMLQSLGGRIHYVHTGVCLWSRPDDKTLVRSDTTQLLMSEFSDDRLEQYLATGDWRGKAGAFGYQDGLDWVSILDGSDSNVVGLPMELLVAMLKEYAS